MRVRGVFIADSARKRRIPDEDILHAYRNHTAGFNMEHGLTMVIGPALDGVLIEVGYVVSDDGAHVIIHAMRPARRKFLR